MGLRQPQAGFGVILLVGRSYFRYAPPGHPKRGRITDSGNLQLTYLTYLTFLPYLLTL